MALSDGLAFFVASLIATSGVAFAVVEWLGVAYLVCLGVSQWRALAARLLSALKNPRQIRSIHRVFGSLFVVAGVLLAGFRRST